MTRHWWADLASHRVLLARMSVRSRTAQAKTSESFMMWLWSYLLSDSIIGQAYYSRQLHQHYRVDHVAFTKTVGGLLTIDACSEGQSASSCCATPTARVVAYSALSSCCNEGPISHSDDLYLRKRFLAAAGCSNLGICCCTRCERVLSSLLHRLWASFLPRVDVALRTAPCYQTTAIPRRLGGHIMPHAQPLMGLRLYAVHLLEPTLRGETYRRAARKTTAYRMGCA